MKGSDIIHQVGTMDVNLAAKPMEPDKAGDLRKSIIAKIVILVLLLVLLLVLILPKAPRTLNPNKWNGEPTDYGKVTVISGTTGNKAEVTDTETIEALVNEVINKAYKRSQRHRTAKIIYSVSYSSLRGSGEDLEISIISDDTICYGNYEYSLTLGDPIRLACFDKLFGEN